MKKIIILFIFVFNFYSQEKEDAQRNNKDYHLAQIDDKALKKINNFPSWIVIEYAKKLRKEYNFNDALVYLLRIQKKDYNNINILYELAITYKEISDFKIAENYFNQVIEKSKTDQSSIIYNSYYDLIEIYKNQDDMKKYKDTLLKIINLNKPDREPNYMVLLKNQYKDILLGNKVFIEKPELIQFDQLVFLYRASNDSIQKAELLLGELLFKEGHYKEATLYSLHSALKIYSKLIEEFSNENIDYVFNDSDELFNLIKDKDRYQAYIKVKDLYRSLYNMSLSLTGLAKSNSNLKHIKNILKIIIDYCDKDDYFYTKTKFIYDMSLSELKSYVFHIKEDYLFNHEGSLL